MIFIYLNKKLMGNFINILQAIKILDIYLYKNEWVENHQFTTIFQIK